MSAAGVNRTLPETVEMSAYDPKRTLTLPHSRNRGVWISGYVAEWLIQCKRDLCNKCGTAPARRQAFRVRDGIDAAARPCIGVSGKNEAVFLRQIGVVVAQVEAENLPCERDADLPIEIGGQRKTAKLLRLITEPGVAGTSGERYADVLRQ